LTFLDRLWRRRGRREALAPLHRAVVALGRDPGWYRAGGMADTIDGRFDTIAAVTALVLLRLESAGGVGREPSVLLAEWFVDDMDSSLRQIGIGDYVVGKHVGRMMGALGGRLAAFREAGQDEQAFAQAVRRNLFHDAPADEAALAWTAGRLARLRDGLAALPLADLLEGKLPEA
jgi:cytochrome b pre-mRNA-processing protein 3